MILLFHFILFIYFFFHTDDKIVDTVEVVAAQQGLDLASTRTGFHWPPFTTISHLHLHVIYPVENMSYLKRQMFRVNSFWFVSVSINLMRKKK